MRTGHSDIFFRSRMYRDYVFSGPARPLPNHHTQVCWYSMHRLWIYVSLSCAPDAHSVSGCPVFSTDAASASFFRTSSSAGILHRYALTAHKTISSHGRHTVSDMLHLFLSYSHGTSHHGKRPAWHGFHTQVQAFPLFRLPFPTVPGGFHKTIHFQVRAGSQPS